MPPRKQSAQKRRATAATKTADVDPEETTTLAAKVAKAAAEAKSKTGKSKAGKTKGPAKNEKAASDTAPKQKISDAEQAVKTGKRLPLSFYDKDCIDLAKDLLGKRLVRKVGSERVSGIIVETEAYLGGEDKAAHSHKGKTKKNAAMFMPPGTGYVYHIYGLYTCMNISRQR